MWSWKSHQKEKKDFCKLTTTFIQHFWKLFLPKRLMRAKGAEFGGNGVVLWPTFHGEMEEWIRVNSIRFWKQP